MKLLLDTHTFLWFIKDDHKLSKKAKTFISEPINTRYLSYASIWEIALKQSIGKIELPDENISVVGVDPFFDKYGIKRIW